MAMPSLFRYVPPAAPLSASVQSQAQEHMTATRPKKLQTRQLLSCTKCRQRKVKCDRLKPCNSCCSRGTPKECHFEVADGNEYSPIQQSYEIRKLRRENEILREKLQAARYATSADDVTDEAVLKRRSDSGSSTSAHRQQRRYRGCEPSDNIYFGTPCLANVVAEFARPRQTTHSISHPHDRARNVYNLEGSAYPFPVLWHGNDTATDILQSLLPSPDMVLESIGLLSSHGHLYCPPHRYQVPSKEEVEWYFSDANDNAIKYPDMLALMLATVAAARQLDAYGLNDDRPMEGSTGDPRAIGDVYMAASMQALRLASFLNSPTLACVQTLAMMDPYLANSGRLLDAYALFGTTIHLAHSIGLHRDPQLLSAVPSDREAMLRRKIWWMMLYSDQRYSMALGRPLGISGIGDCPPPESSVTNPNELRLEEFICHLTVFGRNILGSDGMNDLRRIEEFSTKLDNLCDTMPINLRFQRGWCNAEVPLPEWPLEASAASLFMQIQSFLILLNRQRVGDDTYATNGPRWNGMAEPGLQTRSIPASLIPDVLSQQMACESAFHGSELVRSASVHVLQTFLFFRRRSPGALISWFIGQQAFNACIALAYSAGVTSGGQGVYLIEQALAVFTELHGKGIHVLAESAVQQLSDALRSLRRHEDVPRHASLSDYHNTWPLEMETRAHVVPVASASAFPSDTDPADTDQRNVGHTLSEYPSHQLAAPAALPPDAWHVTTVVDGIRQVHQSPIVYVSEPPPSLPQITPMSSASGGADMRYMSFQPSNTTDTQHHRNLYNEQWI